MSDEFTDWLSSDEGRAVVGRMVQSQLEPGESDDRDWYWTKVAGQMLRAAGLLRVGGWCELHGLCDSNNREWRDEGVEWPRLAEHTPVYVLAPPLQEESTP